MTGKNDDGKKHVGNVSPPQWDPRPTRFLVAIDRRNGAQVAMETVKLAEEFMLSSDGLVVGIDLSGDPTVSHTMLFHVGTWT